MIVDSSAIIAILFNEAEAVQFVHAISAAPQKFVPAPALVEASIVAQGRRGNGAQSELDALIALLKIQTIPFSSDHAQTARDANLKYGKGRGHQAQLNFGDCMSYAVSKIELMPLLFKGDDFKRTDVDSAV